MNLHQSDRQRKRQARLDTLAAFIITPAFALFVAWAVVSSI
jgi:hypothetical protein